jgi:hypothetical protein
VIWKFSRFQRYRTYLILSQTSYDLPRSLNEKYVFKKDIAKKNRRKYFKNVFRNGSTVFRVILKRFSRLELTAVITIRKRNRISIFVMIYKEIIAVKAIFLFALLWLLILYLLNILILGNRRPIYQITRKMRMLSFRPRILLHLTKLQDGDDLQIRLKRQKRPGIRNRSV